MTRVTLSRLPGDRVLVAQSGAREVVAGGDLPAYVSRREPEAPRWVWDDTARWYPPLLAAGVRVTRCHDLRLGRQILRSAPAVEPALLTGDESHHWDRLAPSVSAEPALFAVDDAVEQLRADLEDDRQRAAVAASPEATRLGLLLAAESAGALVAAEMTHAGVPWRSDVHEELLRSLLGPRPPRGARPAKVEALVAQTRTLLEAPTLNPDSRPELLAALRRAGLAVDDTRHHTLAALEHPVIEPLLRYKKLVHLFQTNGWAWSDQWVSGGRFRPSYQPAGSTTGRWSSNGGGALSFPTQIRPAAVADEGWRFVVADVAQLEPRVLAGMSGDRALARAARGADLYQGMVDAGAVATRTHAKLGLLGAMYGATRGESGRMVAGLTQRYPEAFGLVEAAARAGERGEGVRTLLGRGSASLTAAWAQNPDAMPADREAQASVRRAYGRFTRNFVVQGTGAEWALCWIADLRNRLWQLGESGPLTTRPHLVLFLHDEVVIHTPAALAEAVAEQATEAAATASTLLFRGLDIDFPLTISTVQSYAEAGKPGAAES
ncbi:bifunctional 3'-5' exonuclease/DNA polymerase [Nocardioides gilvus]|uniref:bifunctional 3'-5' exonuclease/DNA polymerase n=1 Tax=Nocardioides gilvus TaxID=1735589 RepID=UPI000D74FF3B|nr:bifunctional 3'-5' exonuclease/DNA polymerase [Nocardioides gilvus]